MIRRLEREARRLREEVDRSVPADLDAPQRGAHGGRPSETEAKLGSSAHIDMLADAERPVQGLVEKPTAKPRQIIPLRQHPAGRPIPPA